MKRFLCLFLCLLSVMLPAMAEDAHLHVSTLFLPEYTLPETERPILLSFSTVGVLHIPAGTAHWPVFSDAAIGHFDVHPDNPFFSSVDGAVYSKDGKILLAYPGLKEDTHFEVPFGVEEIAANAFYGNGYLQSVSLPLSLRIIREDAFHCCTGLFSVNLPLSVEEVEAYAFHRCSQLEKVAMGSALYEKLAAADFECFAYCRKLEESLPYSGNEGQLAEKRDELYAKPLRMAVSPENANAYIYATETPEEDGDFAGCFYSGDVVVLEEHRDATADYLHGYFPEEGYLPRNVLVPAPAETLFRITSVLPKNGRVKVMAAGFRPELGDHVYTDVAYEKFVQKTEADLGLPYAALSMETDMYHTDHVATAQLYVTDETGGVFADITFSVLDAVFTREYTGDQKKFGLVISSKPENRVNLRKKASQGSDSLGKYFTGTQVEIIGEKNDFYQVLVNGQKEGWMMKKFVVIVPQEVP